MYLGNATEHAVMALLLRSMREVYAPLVDDSGVDLIVRSKDGTSDDFQEIQVKSLSSGGLFAAISCPNPRANYWYVFHVADIDKMWLINSLDFVKLASQNQKGKNMGKYSIDLCRKTPALRALTEPFVITDFSKLP